MKYLLRKTPLKHQFDFEIGYLVKSPCKKCKQRKQFPQCIDNCTALDKIHESLLGSISCSNRKL